MLGYHQSIIKLTGRGSNANYRHELGLFGDYSLQKRIVSKDTSTADTSIAPDISPASKDLPINVSTWHIGIKYSWITQASDSSSNKKPKLVGLTMGTYFVNIQIAKNTLDSFKEILNEPNVKSSFRGVGIKVALQYGAFGHEFDYRYISPHGPSPKGLIGSTFSTRISISGTILDQF
jgi:hypothetical protein